MPGKEKQNYPPCNRAFTLRMMNPMSYQEGNVSPLDRQIQPVVKKQVAKNVDMRKGSLDDNSSSSVSSTTSYNESALYDIEEHDNRRNGNVSPNEAIKTTATLTPRRNIPRTKPTTNMMTRSYTSADGFNGGPFNRNAAQRSTLPTRFRSKSSSKTSTNSTPSQQRIEAKGTTATVKRSQSLRERPKTALGISRPSTNHAQNQALKKTSSKDSIISPRKTPRSTITIKAKKASSSNKERTQFNGINGHSTKRDYPEDSTESDTSSYFTNEIDSFKQYFRKSSQGGGYLSTSSSTNTLNGLMATCSDSSLENSFDSALQLSSPSHPPAGSIAPSLKDDSFANKLSEMCTLISLRYPGDFQILENLVEMQSAYEQRNDYVNNVVKKLEQNVNNLNNKILQTSRVTNLLAPLMQVTKSFEKELQGVIDSQTDRLSCEQYTQIPETNNSKQNSALCNGHGDIVNGHGDKLSNGFEDSSNGNHLSPLEEIHTEANAVANKIMRGISEQASKQQKTINGTI